MATISAPRNWAAVTRRALGVTAAASVALVALAVPASAHTPTWSADCDEEKKVAFVTVDLQKYVVPKNPSPDKVNTVVLTDGTKKLIDNQNFGAELVKTIELDPTETHNLRLVVTAWDADTPEKKKKYNVDDTQVVEACVEKEQPPAEEPPAEEPPAEQPPAETPTPTTTTTVAIGVNANLAETGASIALPIGIGALLLIGGAGLLLVLRRRDKA